jgi:hypothetical protein
MPGMTHARARPGTAARIAVPCLAAAVPLAAPALAQVEAPEPPMVAPAPPAAPPPGQGNVASPPPAVQAMPKQPSLTIGGGYVHQFSADAGGTGTMSADRVYASLNSRSVLSDELALTLAMGYELDMYRWGGVNGLGVANPWGNVNLFAWQARLAIKVAPSWTLGVGGIFGLAGEADADAGDSIYGGGLASIAWTPDPTLMAGIGFLGVSQIENDPIFVPIPVVHWNFAEEWEVSTIRRPPASPFVGVDVAWEPAGSNADVAVGLGWQQRRFRLASSSDPTTSEGVGLDQSWAIFASVGYDVARTFRVDFIAGCTFSESLELQDSNGGNRRDASVDPNALLGVFGTISF